MTALRVDGSPVCKFTDAASKSFSQELLCDSVLMLPEMHVIIINNKKRRSI